MSTIETAITWCGRAMLLAVALGILARRRYRFAGSFTAYILAWLAWNVTALYRPALLGDWLVWAAKETVYALLRLAIVTELAILVFRGLPRARQRAYLLLGTTFVALAYVLVQPGDAHTPYALAKHVTTSFSYLTAWGLICLLALVAWYRVPLHPLHKAVLHGLLWLLLVQFGALFATARAGYTVVGSASAASFVDHVLAHTRYLYVIATLNPAGEGDDSLPGMASAEAALVPGPIKLSALASTDVRLSWSGVAGAAGYRIFRRCALQVAACPSQGAPLLLATTPPEVTSYMDAAVSPGGEYEYSVAAIVNGIQSAPSKSVTAKPAGTCDGPQCCAPVPGPAAAAPDIPPVTGPPSAPVNVVATAGNHQAQLRWYAVRGGGQMRYKIYRRADVCGPLTAIDEVPFASPLVYDDTGLANGKTYYYAVAGVNSVSEGQISNPVAAMPKRAAPPAPAQAIAFSAGGRVWLHWTPAYTATGYTLRRGAASGGPFAIIGTTHADGFVDQPGLSGPAYYRVSATNAHGEGPARAAESLGCPGCAPSTACTPGQPCPAASACNAPALRPAPADTLVPPPPADLRADESAGRIRLRWALPSGGDPNRALSFSVFRGLSAAGPFVRVAQRLTVRAFAEQGLSDGRPYFYFVVAADGIGDGQRSKVVRATPRPQPPGPPQQVSAYVDTRGRSSGIGIVWVSSWDADSYRVLRGAASGGPYSSLAKDIAKVPGLMSYRDADPKAGAGQYYVVVAENAAGPSPLSREVRAPARDAKLPPTTHVRALPGLRQVSLSWDAVPGATGYRIKRAVDDCRTRVGGVVFNTVELLVMCLWAWVAWQPEPKVRIEEQEVISRLQPWRQA